jgi:hypothetical protein
VGAEPECFEAAVEPFRGASLRTSPFPVPVARERKGKRKRDMKLNDVVYLFFDAVIMAEVKRRLLRLPKVPLALP